jgi:hypothetical protein
VRPVVAGPAESDKVLKLIRISPPAHAFRFDMVNVNRGRTVAMLAHYNVLLARPD